MKISIVDFENRLMPFLMKVAKAPNEEANRFAAAVVLMGKAKEIKTYLASQADPDGKIDTDELKKVVDAGFEASGGTFPIKINHKLLKLIGAEPENVKIQKADADQFFAGIGA